MKEVSQSVFEKNFDEYMDLIESGESFIIRMEDGRGVAAVPAEQLEPLAGDKSDEEWYNMLNDHNDAP
jgi:PHD/YefM family antitoxin component YafN of YafNO toxin-antitoxin module